MTRFIITTCMAGLLCVPSISFAQKTYGDYKPRTVDRSLPFASLNRKELGDYGKEVRKWDLKGKRDARAVVDGVTIRGGEVTISLRDSRGKRARLKPEQFGSSSRSHVDKLVAMVQAELKSTKAEKNATEEAYAKRVAALRKKVKRPGVTEENVKLLRRGMTLEQVKIVLGDNFEKTEDRRARVTSPSVAEEMYVFAGSTYRFWGQGVRRVDVYTDSSLLLSSVTAKGFTASKFDIDQDDKDDVTIPKDGDK